MALMVAVMVLLTGCSEPLHHGLDEGEANAMVVALSAEGFGARKVRDPDQEGLWAVVVPEDQRVEAWGLLEREGLPRPRAGGFEDFYPTSGLIPTAQEERVMLQVATSRELQASLLQVPGVVDARVHLVIPEKPRVRLRQEEGERPRGSVLVKWMDGVEPVLTPAEVQRLIAGGVEGLHAEDVEVVYSTGAARPPPGEEATAAEVVRLGPLEVGARSQGPLKALILGMGGVIIALSAGLVYVVVARRRLAGDP